MENTEDINNSLAAIGSIASRVHQGQGGQYESSLKGTIVYKHKTQKIPKFFQESHN